MAQPLRDQFEFLDDLLGGIPWKVATTEICCDSRYRHGKDRKKCIWCGEKHISVNQSVSLQGHIIVLAVTILDEPTEEERRSFITGFTCLAQMRKCQTQRLDIGCQEGK